MPSTDSAAITMRRRTFLHGLGATVATLSVPGAGDATSHQPAGQLTIAFDTTIASAFLDPAEVAGLATPFTFLYALHDALIKPLPGNNMAPCLATSWQESPDGLTYDFTLRQGLRFHNGDPFTAEDVQFTFQRYKGAAANLLQERVRTVEIVDPYRVRFVLHQPWPDFLTFYGTLATGASWIVPKKYVEQVGNDGFKQRPIGLGPYRFVSAQAGLELTLDANEHYWRKPPSIQRIVFKGVPERTTRLAMLKTGEADIAYLMIGDEAVAIKADPKLRLAQVISAATWWLDFAEQWQPTSPWHDRRVRLAANLAIDRKALNESERLGLSRLTGSILPSSLDFVVPMEPYPYDPAQAQRLLAEAGYAKGFDAGDITPTPPFNTFAESVAAYLGAVGIRVRVRTMERAAFIAAWRDKKLQGLIGGSSAALGNAATRLETFVAGGGTYAYGSYSDIDALLRQQAGERDRSKREALLHQIQRLMHERIMHVPIWEPATLHGLGPRVEEAGVGLNPLLYFTAPYEELRLRTAAR